MTPLGNDLLANGVPTRAAAGMVRDSRDNVLDYYRAEFARQGLRPFRRDLGNGAAMVGAVDEPRGQVLTAAAIERTDGTVEIRASLAELGRGRMSFAAPEDLPFVPGSGGFFVSRSREGLREGTTVQAVNWATVEDNVSFYARSLGPDGWKQAADKPRPERGALGRSLRFERNDRGRSEELFVALEPLGESGGTSVFLTRTSAVGLPRGGGR